MESFCTPDNELPNWAKPKSKDDPPSELKSELFRGAKNAAFVIGITLLVFASARNSITWQLDSFWEASANFYEYVWRTIHEGWFGGNDLLLVTVGTHGLAFIWYWLNAFFFAYLDFVQPKYFMKYKIQEDAKVTKAEILQAIPVCLQNQFVVFLLLFPLHLLSIYRGQQISADVLPSFHRVLFEICVSIIVHEIGFYYSHRLLHHSLLYRHIHKIHHEWKAPVSLAGLYAHPFEHCVSVVMPIYLGPFIMGSHISTVWLWTFMATFSNNITHSGYHLPFLPSPEAHDYHHLKFTNNFGQWGVLDRFHGTDNMFVKTKSYDRHVMLIGLSSAKDRFPDEEKKIC